jgi:hypothetical protein
MAARRRHGSRANDRWGWGISWSPGSIPACRLGEAGECAGELELAILRTESLELETE